MASKMGYYNMEQFIKQKRQQEKEIKVPPRANLLAAAHHIRSLFEAKKFNYAFMGGLEMLCLGYRREMHDLQVAYDDKDFHKIKSKLESDQRIRLPEGMNSLFPAKILVCTGPAYKSEGCTQSGDIEIDLVPPGSHGTPPNGSLANNLVLLSLKTETKLRSYKGLNMLYLVKTLVHYCRVRDLAWDPRKDILFLCQHYAEEVQSIRLQLDQKAVQQNFLATPSFTRLSLEDQRRCYQILLGTKPPPTMAITPPPPLLGHKHSASDPDASMRPRLSSHQSSPTLNAYDSSALLSPPLPGKPRAASSHLSVGRPQISELPATPDVRLQKPSELPGTTRDSRSRYRPVSAPNTRDASPVDIQAAVPKTAHIRQRSQPSAMPTHHLASNPAPMNHLQPSSHLPALVPSQVPHTVPNLNTGSSGPISPYAYAQTPELNGVGSGSQKLPNYTSPAEMFATPVILNPGQRYMKAQLGLAGGLLPRQNHISNVRITERPMPPQARFPHQGEQLARAERSDVSTEPARTGQLYVVNPDVEESSQKTPAVGEPHTQSSLSRVKLDASSQLGQFIAELSAERSTPAPEPSVEHRSKSGAQQDLSTRANTTPHQTRVLRDSPVSPPDHTTSQKEYWDIPIRPLNPRTIPAPGAALPASLMAGGMGLHQRTPSATLAAGSAPTNLPNTNASKYTRYYSSQPPPSSAPISPPATVSTYKAYQPTLSPTVQPPALSPPSIPLSPPSATLASPAIPDTTIERQPRFTAPKDVDAKEENFKHKRDASHDSQASSRSCDSRELAMEYRKELVGLQGGYGSEK